MKIKNLFLSTLTIIMAMTSCSTDNHNEVNSHEGEDMSNATTYMSIKLIGTQDATRTTPGEDGSKPGSTEESVIKTALVLLADGNGLVKSAITPALEPTSTGANTKPFKVLKDTYYVYVIANPGDITKSQVENKTIKDIEVLMYENGQIKDYAGANSFLMFNECNGTNDTEGAKIEVTEQNTIDNPAQSTEPIKLDRLATKLTSSSENIDIEGIEGQLEGITDVSLDGFVLLNGAKKAYLQQHWSSTIQNDWPYKNTLITPAVSFNDFYATYSDYAYVKVKEDGDAAGLEYTVKDLIKDGESWNTAPVYCMENNSKIGGESGLIGSSTGIIYRWQAANSESDGLAGTNCFYSYNGEYFSTLKELQNAYYAVFNTENKVSDTQAERDAEYDDAVALLTDDIGQFRAKYLIKVYENGVMYYTHYIKDSNYVGADDKSYYAIMRNTIYSLNVTALLKIGTDIPGGWGPEPEPTAPIDTKELYMLVKTEVNDWVLSDQDITLE